MLRLVLKARYRDYVAYQNQKFKVNNEKLGLLLGAVSILGPALMLLKLLNW